MARKHAKPPFNWVRAIVVTAGAFVLAAILFAQAASSALARKQPTIAVQINPYNGLAYEHAAVAKFIKGAKAQKDILPQAIAASPLARLAFKHDALTPKAHALLAISATDLSAKNSILAAALRTNRRDLLLQGVVLEAQTANNDYASALDTIDTILRVHPEQQANFFPALLGVLAKTEALPAFKDILARKTSNWRADFLNVAAGNPVTLSNLAKLRLNQSDEIDPKTDSQIISGLFKIGQLDQSYAVYRAAVASSRQASSGAGKLDWLYQYPPFDWTFADQGNFRAQESLGSTGLELFVRNGSGGVLAERIIKAPPGEFTLSMTNTLGAQDGESGARLNLSCVGGQTLIEAPISGKKLTASMKAVPGNCKFLRFAISARAWSGGPSIRGELGQLEIKAD